MSYLIITPVGTSLIGNCKRSNAIDVVDAVTLTAFLNDKQTIASAEVKSVDAYVSELAAHGHGVSPNEVFIALLKTETKESEVCASVLERYFQEQGFQVFQKIISGMQ